MSLTVEIATAPDRDHWVGEIWNGDTMIAEVNRLENGTPTLEIYAPDGTLRIDLAAFVSSIHEIKTKLGMID